MDENWKERALAAEAALASVRKTIGGAIVWAGKIGEAISNLDSAHSDLIHDLESADAGTQKELPLAISPETRREEGREGP